MVTVRVRVTVRDTVRVRNAEVWGYGYRQANIAGHCIAVWKQDTFKTHFSFQQCIALTVGFETILCFVQQTSKR